MKQALYKTIDLYHMGEIPIINEINFEDALRITKSAET